MSTPVLELAGPAPQAQFEFPKTYHFPPFFTLQPTEITRQAQLKMWSNLVQSYCRANKVFQLSIVDAREWPLFHNAKLKKRLADQDIKQVIEFMVSPNGNQRAEWTSSAKAVAWIWWRTPEEWANLIASWVDETGQRNTVLTLYEIAQGEATTQQEFYCIDVEVLKRALAVLTKSGKAQVFGTDDQKGVKFF